jgi:hypothetical protein
LPASQADQLAYYSSQDLGVLAPRNWHCFGLYGSNGSVLIVTPLVLKANELFGEKPIRLSGPAIVSSFSFGGTSGRFEVWRAIGRYFPTALDLVDRQDWSLTHDEPLPTRPYAADIVVTRAVRSIRIVTLSGQDGEGTSGYLSRGPLPIIALRQLMGSNDDTSLLAIDVRLPAGQNELTSPILDNPGGSSMK